MKSQDYKTPTAEIFVKAWVAAHRRGETVLEVADQLGIPVQRVHTRAYTLRKKGVKLPNLKPTGGRGYRLDIDKLNKIVGS